MTVYESYIVYPEGGVQEINRALPINTIVDINGVPLSFPLPTNKIIAYRVYKKRTTEQTGQVTTWYYLELVSAAELRGFV